MLLHELPTNSLHAGAVAPGSGAGQQSPLYAVTVDEPADEAGGGVGAIVLQAGQHDHTFSAVEEVVSTRQQGVQGPRTAAVVSLFGALVLRRSAARPHPPTVFGPPNARVSHGGVLGFWNTAAQPHLPPTPYDPLPPKPGRNQPSDASHP